MRMRCQIIIIHFSLIISYKLLVIDTCSPLMYFLLLMLSITLICSSGADKHKEERVTWNDVGGGTYSGPESHIQVVNGIYGYCWTFIYLRRHPYHLWGVQSWPWGCYMRGKQGQREFFFRGSWDIIHSVLVFLKNLQINFVKDKPYRDLCYLMFPFPYPVFLSYSQPPSCIAML